MTIDDLIDQARAKLRRAKIAEDTEQAALLDLRDRLAAGDTSITRETVSRQAATRDVTRAETERLQGELDAMLAEKSDQERIAHLQSQTYDTGVTRGGTMRDRTYVVGEPSTYTADQERTGQTSFLRDLFAAQVKNDSQAHERLARHGREVAATLSKRAGVDTSTVPSFVPPQYVVDLFAEYARAGRPVANMLTSLPLPPTGMTVTVPKITTPSTVGVQSTQNTALSNQDPVDTGIDVAVKTVGGAVPVSRQTLERGLLVEEMIFGDLAAAYNQQLDVLTITAALAQSSTNQITYTDASPTVVELWPKLADAVGKVRSQRFTGPNAIVMHPTRYAWLQAALGTDNRPLFMPGAGGPSNAMGTSENAGEGQIGQILGVPVVLDANIPTNLGTGTNEDAILVADFRDSIIMEDPARAPLQLKFESVAPQNLTVHLVAYGYSAVTFARQPKSISKINGTGLVAPGAL